MANDSIQFDKLTEEEIIIMDDQDVTTEKSVDNKILLTPTKNSRIEAGISNSSALNGNEVWIWGASKNLNGDYRQSLFPIQQIQDLDSDDDFTFALAAMENLELLEDESTLPELILVKYKYSHSIGLGEDGTVWGWGDNTYGQLGDGSVNTEIQLNATQVISSQPDTYFEDAGFVDVGLSHTIILKANGTVWSVGSNEFGQLGDGTNESKSIPVQVVMDHLSTPLDNVVEISAGKNFNLALRADGTVWSWGKNDVGQLGDGSFVEKFHAVQVGNTDLGSLISVASIRAGGDHAIALQSEGSVWAWGDNSNGQVGDSTFENRNIPVKVKGIDDEEYLTGVTEIAAGEKHNLAVYNDSIVSWGSNSEGQLGNGTTIDAATPLLVTLQNQTIPIKEYIYVNNQLTTVFTTIGTAKYKQSFVYDLNGNITSEVTIKVQ